MIYWKPKLVFAESLETPDLFVEQFGGVPWGLPEEKWPHCKDCGLPMSLLAQLVHHPERLDLGKEGRVLYLFICNGLEIDCSTYDAESGANCVLILNRDELKPRQTIPPSNLKADSVLPECRVIGWSEKDDGIPDHFAPYLLTERFSPHLRDEVWMELRKKLEYTTRLGSVPNWVQYPELPEGFRFAGQIDYCLEITGPMAGKVIKEEVNGRTTWKILTEQYGPLYISPSKDLDNMWHLPFANFGDSGTGYLFVNPDPEKPESRFLWQCY